MMSLNEPPYVNALRNRLAELLSEHRDMDDVITRLVEQDYYDELQLKRFKKRKLLLKDQIARIQREIDPDIPA